ncbi:hypothetical protein BJ508DRAFT_417657 [Ascobolus immersus RN42]|uniref:BTB domain-containing protein n=1 Tax=Ascobolus immersus RN42 TaxID=1160509 RepID=A0A3N4HR27_ASCIM|nr:hypothetical protein BJ508DRAFT_417657 [Ascobolus immersus RN42]
MNDMNNSLTESINHEESMVRSENRPFQHLPPTRPPLAWHFSKKNSSRSQQSPSHATLDRPRVNTQPPMEEEKLSALFRGGIYLWSNGKLAMEEEGNLDILAAPNTAGSDADAADAFVMQSGSDEQLIKITGGGSNMVRLDEVFSPLVLHKLFDLCQGSNSSADKADSSDPSQRVEGSLQIPDYLKADFTIVLQGPPPPSKPSETAPANRHQRQRSMVIPDSPLRKPVSAPPRTPQRPTHARSSSTVTSTQQRLTTHARSRSSVTAVPKDQATHSRSSSVALTPTRTISEKVGPTRQNLAVPARVPSPGTPMKHLTGHRRTQSSISSITPTVSSKSASTGVTTDRVKAPDRKPVSFTPSTPSKGHLRTPSRQSPKPEEVEIARFHVHKEVLSLCSEYYASLFSGPWAETQSAVSTLSTENVGSAFGLEQALRMCYTGPSINTRVLSPSYAPKGTRAGSQLTPLFIHYDKKEFLEERVIVNAEDGSEKSVSFLASLKPLQFEHYIRLNLSVLQAADYLLMNKDCLDLPTIVESKIDDFLLPALKKMPSSDFMSRLPPIFLEYPGVEMDKLMKVFVDTGFTHWKKPMLSWPDAAFEELHKAIREHIAVASIPSSPRRGPNVLNLLQDLSKFRRGVRSKSRQFGEWEEKVFGPVRTLLAEKVLEIMEKSGHWNQVDGDVEDGIDFSKNRLVLSPIHASNLSHQYEEEWRKDPLPKDEKYEAAAADKYLWMILMRIRDLDEDTKGSQLEVDDMIDLMHWCTTPKGKQVVDRITEEPVGGEGLLHAGNVGAVEKLLDAFVAPKLFCQRPQSVERFEPFTRRANRYTYSQTYDHEVEILQRRIEKEKEKWKMGWVAF